MNRSQPNTSAPRRPEAGHAAPIGRTPVDPASCGTASPWDPQLDTLVLVDRWNFRLLV